MTRWTPLQGIILALLLAGPEAGCGSTTQTSSPDMSAGPATGLGICHAGCAWKRTCSPQSVTATCDSDCDMMAGTFMDMDTLNDQRCTNAAAIRQETLNCLKLSCDEVSGCQNRIDSCMPP